MNFSVERPYAFYGLFLLIPALLYIAFRYRRLLNGLGGFYDSEQNQAAFSFRRFRRNLKIRCTCSACAWIMLVFAYSGISWGSAAIPVRQSGNAVSLVFDISWSMNAADSPGGLTRLKASVQYADMLLSYLNGDSVSVVLAKGDGVIAVPLTQDMAAVRSLLENLSPDMMSAAGTSLGKGIRAAVRSFPQNLSQFESVWVFTDGDETDGQLTAALTDTIRYGIAVTLVGFGSERETEVVAGDGKTKVKTALRSDRIKLAVSSAVKKAGVYQGGRLLNRTAAQYVDATEAGSALKLLRPLTGNVRNSETVPTRLPSVEKSTTVFKMQIIHRQGLFLGAGIIFFVLGFLLSELDLHSVHKQSGKRPGPVTSTLLVVFLYGISLLFVSCKVDFSGSKRILQSTWAWQQKNYRKAVTGFLRTEEEAVSDHDTVMQQYAIYDLASTYLMQGEYAAAMTRLESILPDAPVRVRFAACYNAGIVAYRTEDYIQAATWFRKALLADGSNVDAKINLELTLRQQKIHKVQGGQQSAVSIPADRGKASLLEREIFKRIQENEQRRWKNQTPVVQKGKSVIDY